jgi:hypothetical protein
MKLETAIKTIEKDAKFLGMKPDALMLEVKKHGALVFPVKVVEACGIYENHLALHKARFEQENF